MNRKIGMWSSIINLVAVVLFALFMLVGFSLGSYFICMFIALSFVPMVSCFNYYSTKDKKVAAQSALIFAGMYAVFILIVYFAQITSVVNDNLNETVLQILDYQKFGLFFNYDLLGYGLMAISTFFIGLTIDTTVKAGKWLKNLLLIHGVFAICCFLIPMLGLFQSNASNSEWIGILVLIIWCLYFIPISALSYSYFKNIKSNDGK